jgi:hypothetical protein
MLTSARHLAILGLFAITWCVSLAQDKPATTAAPPETAQKKSPRFPRNLCRGKQRIIGVHLPGPASNPVFKSSVRAGGFFLCLQAVPTGGCHVEFISGPSRDIDVGDFIHSGDYLDTIKVSCANGAQQCSGTLCD